MVVDAQGNPVRSDANSLSVVPIETAEETRLKPRLTGSGATRGTQIVGYGKIKIDGSNDRISLTDDDSTVTIGDIDSTDDSFGIAVTDDSDDRLVSLGRTTSSTYGFSVYDSDNMRLLAGKYPDGDIKIKLSQSGYDVTTAQDDQLIWSSDFNMPKIVLSGTTSLSYDGDVNTFVTISHGLDYIPIVLAYAQLPNTVDFSPMEGQYIPMPFRIDRASLPSVQGTQSADATSIYLRVHDIYSSGGSPNTYNFRYYVLKETAS